MFRGEILKISDFRKLGQLYSIPNAVGGKVLDVQLIEFWELFCETKYAK
jgi:hypothetical protein